METNKTGLEKEFPWGEKMSLNFLPNLHKVNII